MNRPKEFLAWAVRMFGPVALHRRERLMRFVEEAIELVHADGLDYPTFEAIARRVYSQKPGDLAREIAQAQVCLECYAESIGLSADELAGIEWRRVQTVPQAEWLRRHSAKEAIGIASKIQEVLT